MSTRKRSMKTTSSQEQVPVKATNAQIHQRVNQVHKLLILGRTRAFILQYCADHWAIEERQTDEYIARARTMLEEQAALDREAQRQMALARLGMIFNEAFDGGAYKDALGAQHQLNRIVGLYAPKELNVSGSLTWAQIIEQAREDTDDSDHA